MLDMITTTVIGIMFVGLIVAFAWAKADKDMKKPEKREAMRRLEWYKQHRAIAKYRK